LLKRKLGRSASATRQEKARVEARQHAAVEVARLEAEAMLRLEADNARRAHELELARAKSLGGSRRVQHVLAALLAVFVLAGALGGWDAAQSISRLEEERESLRDAKLALAEERDKAQAAERDALREQRLALEDARRARRGRIAELDRRRDDLAAFAAKQRRSSLMDSVTDVAERAHADDADEKALAAYAKALDELSKALAGNAPLGKKLPPKDERPDCTNPHDPFCGPDGKMMPTR
jgi:hypothetical protein